MVRHRVEKKNHGHGDCQVGGIWAISVVLEGYRIFLKVTTS